MRVLLPYLLVLSVCSPVYAGNVGITDFNYQIESTDRILNKYWEEYLLLEPENFQFASILPHLTIRNQGRDNNNHPLAELLSRRISQYHDSSNFHLQKILGGDRGGATSFCYRLLPYYQNVSADDALPVQRIGLNAESWLQPAASVQLHLRARLENHGELYSQFYGRIWKEKLTGWIDNAALYFFKNKFFGSIGRSFVVWGPHHRDALLLSDNSPPFDRLWLGYEHSLFRFDYLLTRIDDINHKGTVLQRHLTAHRLSFRKAGLFELGLSEVVLFGGADRPFEWHYLNPFLPYYWEQWNQGTDDNLFLGTDFALYLPDRIRIFGELMIDDFQIDFKSEPHQVAYKIGADMIEPLGLPFTFLSANYTRVNGTVYGQNQPQNLYLHYGQPIGYFGGNDQDRILVLLRRHISSALDLEFEFSHTRRGEGRIDQHEKPGVPYGITFPSGVVEKSSQVLATLALFTRQLVEGNLQVGYAHYANYNHVQDVSHQRLSFNIYLSWYLQGVVR